MIFEAPRNLLICRMYFYRRMVPRIFIVDGRNKGSYGGSLPGVMVRVVPNDHPRQWRNVDSPRLRAHFAGNLRHHFGCHRHKSAIVPI